MTELPVHPGWEYREINVPLEIHVRRRGAAPSDLATYYSLVHAWVHDARQDGWEPSGLLDFNDALASGRIELSRTRTWFGLRTAPVYRSLRLTLKRRLVYDHDSRYGSVSWFDVLKELNAHSGRILTVTSIMIALLIYTINTQPIQERLHFVLDYGWFVRQDASATLLFMALATIGLIFSFVINSWVIVFPLPERMTDQDDCNRHVDSTRDIVKQAGRSLNLSFFTYLLLWYVVYDSENPSSSIYIFGIKFYWLAASVIAVTLTLFGLVPTVRDLTNVSKRLVRKLIRPRKVTLEPPM